MSDFVVRPLESGVPWFHTMSSGKERTYEANRSLKCGLVDEGGAHAALVYEGDDAVAWCQSSPHLALASEAPSAPRPSRHQW